MGKCVNSIFLVLSLFLMVSCEKSEGFYQLAPDTGSKVVTVAMREDYSREVLLSLEDGRQTAMEMFGWDLAFECGENGKAILLNTGKNVMAYNAGKIALGAPVHLAGAHWEWDKSNGHTDSLAIGRNWQQQGSADENTFVIDRGSLLAPEHRYKQLKPISVNETSYWVYISNLDGSNQILYQFHKGKGVNYVYFTFDNNGLLSNVEPHQRSWHLRFMRYKTWATAIGQTIPYIVTGVWLNPHGVSCAKVEHKKFADIDRHYAMGLSFSSQRDFVGFDWKGLNFDFYNTNYTIHSEWTYVLKDSKGVYYKFRFLDFYDENQKRGYPKIEYQRL